MSETRGLQLTPSAAVKEKRLAALLGGRDESAPRLVEDVEDAQLLGSLELAGLGVSWAEVKRARHDGGAPSTPLARLRDAQHAVARAAPFSLDALLAWHRAASGTAIGFRASERTRAGPPPSPAAFVRSRLEILEQWLNADSGRELTPSQAGALTMARLVEIEPFDEANGRVARLAASHAMTRAGARAPILVGGDRPRLAACLDAAFQLQTEPLAALLAEASARAVDVMIQTLESDAGASR